MANSVDPDQMLYSVASDLSSALPSASYLKVIAANSVDPDQTAPLGAV